MLTKKNFLAAEIRAAQPLCVITDGWLLRSRGTLVSAVAAALRGAAGGVAFVQLREQVGGRPATDAEVVELGRELLPLCRAASAKLIVSRRHDLAAEIGADGVHLGGEVSSFAAIGQTGDGMMVGYSAHSVEEARAAVEWGYDYLLVGPIFSPLSKSSTRRPLGLEVLGQLKQAAHLVPVFALGGVTSERVSSCRDAGANGVAAITSLVGSPDPEKSAAEFMKIWREN